MHLNSPDNMIFFFYLITIFPPACHRLRSTQKKKNLKAKKQHRSIKEIVVFVQHEKKKIKYIYAISILYHFCVLTQAINRSFWWWKWKWFEAHWVEKIVVWMAAPFTECHRANSLFSIFISFWFFFVRFWRWIRFAVDFLMYVNEH